MVYTALFNRVSRPAHIGQEYILLTDIYDSEGNLFRDHLWAKYSHKRWSTIKPNTKVSFTAKVEAYAHDDSKQRLAQIRNVKVL